MSTRPGIPQAQMGKLLEQGFSASEQLKQLLAAEQQAITARNIPVFEEIIEKKRLMLERVVQYEQQRISLLESCGIKHGPGSMDDYLKACLDDGKLTDLWQRLLSMAANCRDHNRRNHQLVELCSAHTRKALCVLRGEAMDQNVYGPDGDTSDPHENRFLTIA
jgi:flagellar biosynthesis/type III secretory pathway chaperone